MTQLERLSGCKVNLLLNILGKRPDGFHELETLMYPVPVQDRLTFDPLDHPGIELTCSHPALPTDHSNLVYRAARAFLERAKVPTGVRIHLEKRIPLAAGLGGGSSNAAVTLLTLNELFGEPLPEHELTSLAAGLGSDVPFFLQPKAALGTGRGEAITPIDGLQALRGLSMLLIHPGFGVATAWAYRALAEFPEALHGRPGRAQQLINCLKLGNLAEAAQHLFNSLEGPVLKKYPVLALYQDFLRANGALGTLMSGSGSSTFALLSTADSAEELGKRFKAQFGEHCWTTVAAL